MHAIRNRWSLRIELGSDVTYHHARGGRERSIVIKIEEENGQPRLTMNTGATCHANDVAIVHLKGDPEFVPDCPSLQI